MFKDKRILHVLIIALVIASFSLGIKIGAVHETPHLSAGQVAQRSEQSNTLNGHNRVTLRLLSTTLSEIIKESEANYYKKVDPKDLMKGAIRGALAALNDPYSFYMEPKDFKRERENIHLGEFGGLGIRIYEDKKDHLVKISMPLPNTPAMKEGLQAGDIIVKIESEKIILDPLKLTLDDVVDKLRGEVGKPVTLTIHRRSALETFDVTIVRDIIKINSVEQKLLDNNIGYIKIQGNFTGRTYKEFASALKSLQDGRKLNGLILDLRYNPGGLLEAAWNVSDAFLSKGTIVSTRGRPGVSKYDSVYAATRHTLLPPEVPLVVLVNGFSASGSEIVAGAIKDSKRGILVGKKTYGKGLVQQRIELKKGLGAVSLTISAYYTPNGTFIQGEGITPNIELEAWAPSDIDQLMLLKARKADLIENFVIDYIKTAEAETGVTPKDFSAFSAKLPDLIGVLDEKGIHFEDEKTVVWEARQIFDINVGITEIGDTKYDPQLQRAIEVIQSGEIAQILSFEGQEG